MEHFLDYVSNYLAPSLHPGDIVIIDNLRHKVSGVQQVIQSGGAQVLYLPSYSPDFNPIEIEMVAFLYVKRFDAY